MATETSKLVVTKNVDQAYQKYRQLKLEVDAWQQERRSYWLVNLSLAEESPYLPIADLPQDAIIELWQRLNISAKVEITDAALREMWEQLEQGQNDMDPEMATRLQMAVSGVAKLASQTVDEKGVPEQKYNPRASENPEKNLTVCPVCGEITTLTVLTEPDGKRMMHCTTCSFEWPVQRTGCLFCGSEDSKKLLYLDNEAFPGIEMAVCEVCGQYFKEIDGRRLPVKDYVWEDLRTLPLNYATEHWLEEQVKKNNQIN
ncbi:MAG: formate dehydrogenase accessory protein FdhE [Syntrophomonadaceae bacterium]|nr:formate dehydrogenase accessory protein FdhE [Syntrophomonadaceae bacterium]MDD3023727.1 formate dehydrogenase accessory protein FdhE [Syntrophomonadaceae bacterium]